MTGLDKVFDIRRIKLNKQLMDKYGYKTKEKSTEEPEKEEPKKEKEE